MKQTPDGDEIVFRYQSILVPYSSVERDYYVGIGISTDKTTGTVEGFINRDGLHDSMPHIPRRCLQREFDSLECINDLLEMMIDAEHSETEEREAKFGEKMISLDVRFWTDGIAEEKGMIVPKHAAAAGVVKLNRNDSHGIKTTADPIIFNSPMQLLDAIEKLLIREGITLHLSSQTRKYVSTE